MKSPKFIKLLLASVVCFCVFQSCEDEATAILVEEPIKDIAGTWKVIQIHRNGEDLSKRMKFENFQMVFKADGTYTLSDDLPFLVDGPGKYALNDPQYPFSLILSPTDQEEHLPVKFQFPIVEGQRQLSLNLSLGCTSNTYQYVFQRVIAE
ncbi:DUF5004 domain-containing protein [Sphingobacterium sp. HJSM2_6]|uniref:DUF5004 domain-containing protein n=1 Tax=Sphingobacterium sp. HJSM2_6 TaxID=3366264 RepID=UPI003BE79E08